MAFSKRHNLWKTNRISINIREKMKEFTVPSVEDQSASRNLILNPSQRVLYGCIN